MENKWKTKTSLIYGVINFEIVFIHKRLNDLQFFTQIINRLTRWQESSLSGNKFISRQEMKLKNLALRLWRRQQLGK